jgi:hypothetical protein
MGCNPVVENPAFLSLSATSAHANGPLSCLVTSAQASRALDLGRQALDPGLYRVERAGGKLVS